MSLFHKVDRDIKREGGGGGSEREIEREGARERRRDGDKGEQRKRRVGLLSLLRPCVLRAGVIVGGHVTSARQCLLCQ